MTSAGVQAWVTSAVEDKAVNKAIVLAGSLRRVYTAKKLAVLTTLTVSKELREKLKEAFDLVILLEQDTPNGLNLEDYAKVQGFSLLVFNKCVYLSPNTLVLKNCDEIFEKYDTFAAYFNGTEVDPSVYIFKPSLDHGRALEKIVHYTDFGGERTKGNFHQYFNAWMKNHVPKYEKLDERYNLRVDLGNRKNKSLKVDVTIANFTNVHPTELSIHDLEKTIMELGPVEKFALELYARVYGEDVQMTLRNEVAMFHRSQHTKEPIAIVGMSFRLPGGNNIDEFWEMMINGKEAIRPLPSFRWKREHITRQCTDRTVQGGFLSIPVDEFDAKFFGISPKEAEFLDPQQRLLHEVSWEALEDAQIDPHTLKGTQTGVFCGSWLHDYKDIALKSSDVEFFRVYMGNSLAPEAARLSHFLETTGPSIATESGCSSAIVAVHMACKSLQNHETNLALACGVNLLLHPFDQDTLSFVISPNGRCKTFDASADGFGRAEACAVLLMKRMSDAVKDGDNIWGLIRGSSVVQEGLSKSLGTPTVHCESLAMELALKDGGVNPKDVSFVEAHGTGTPVGDPLEIAAIAKAYSKGRRDPLLIGSVKTNVGHTESVSGITGIIKVLLSLKNEKIPPHLNLETLNPAINLEAIPAEIPLTPKPWLRQIDKPRIAGVSSFGISGTDGHAIVQEPPLLPSTQIDYEVERPLHIMKISAKSPESMEKLLATYQQICEEKSQNGSFNEEEFANLAYSANTGRATFNHRVVIVGKNFSQAAKILTNKTFSQADIQSNGKQLGFLFTGQGSQYPSMAHSLYSTSPIFRDHFDKCDEVLAKRYGIDMRSILWGKSSDGAELSRTLYSQTSIFCVEYCLLKLWESWGVKPDFVIGHSLGEFAAAVAAGALDFEDALMLVAERSRLIDALPRGKMLVIRADKKTVDDAVSKFKGINPKFWVDYAALNASDQTVVAGDSALIDEFAKYCGESLKLKTIVLAATHAFHSRHMDPMLQAYRKVALTVKKLNVEEEDLPKYISGMEGKLVERSAINADYWVRHTREKVSYIDACKAAESEGCSLFLEVGPHPVLSALTMMNYEGSITCLPSIRRKEDEWGTILESLGKLYLSEWKGEVDWKGFDKYYKRTRVSLPKYPFNRRAIWVNSRYQTYPLHPLLGKLIPNASGQFFENELTIKNANFVQDHVIGNTIVFPGAGFLEMCLAGGYSTVQGLADDLIPPRRPMVLKGLKIKSPLALYESQFCILQTVVHLDEKDDELGYNVNIYRHDATDPTAGGQWISHASAKFLPVVPSSESYVPPNIDIKSIQASGAKIDNKEFYEKLPEVGLRFGPKFQSLESGWQNDKGVLLKVKVPEDTGSYLIHPVVADAMIQAVMLWTSKDKMKKKLQVPVHIEEFLWLASAQSPDRYVYCSTTDQGKHYAVLVDQNGESLAFMGSVDFAETTVKLVEGMIQQQAAAMPQLWEEIWKNVPGPLQSCQISYLELESDRKITPENVKAIEGMADQGEQERYFFHSVTQFTKLYFLNALYNLGFKPEVGKWFTAMDVIKSTGISERFAKYSRFFLKTLSGQDFFDMKVDPSGGLNHSFQFKKLPPTSQQIAQYIKSTTTPDFLGRSEYNIIRVLGENLAGIISGKEEPLPYLFPEDPKKPSAEKYYEAMRVCTNEAIVKGLFSSAIPLQIEAQRKSAGKYPCRILEIGAGTGAFSKQYLSILDGEDVEYEFWYTDVSAAFFTQAETFFDKGKSIVFKKYNMDEDPLEQGLYPEYFDVITACEVLHVSKNMKKTLHNLRSLLRPGGIIQFVETVQQDPRTTFIFGLLDGYWQFEDFDIRPDHTTLTLPKWYEVLESVGFTDVNGFSYYENTSGLVFGFASNKSQLELRSLRETGSEKHSWVIFDDNTALAAQLEQRLTSLNRKVIVIQRPSNNMTEELAEQLVSSAMDAARENKLEFEGIIYLWGLSTNVNDNDQTRISLPFVNLCQNISRLQGKLPRTHIITHGLYAVDDSEVTNPSPATVLGIAKAVSNEDLQIHLHHIDLCITQSPEDQIEEVYRNIWITKDNRVALRGGKRLCPRLAAAKIPNDYLSIPNGCDRYKLVLPSSRLISDLEFAYLNPYALADDEVEIQIKAIALNFRDVFAVIKPIKEFENLNAVGLDFAGVVSKVGPKATKFKVGDCVTGMNLEKDLSLPSHIKVKERLLSPLSNRQTFAEGATLPAVFSTVVYCLVQVANMKKGETLLLHTATGGVGLCAIQLAQQVGVNIIGTAGSRKKRNFLRDIGIKHVFNSRTTEFGKQVLETTGGKGVDIVLNSLTGEGFKEASLNALGRNGRFIEMSKLNIWKPEEVKALRPDVFYKVADLMSLNDHEFEELAKVLKVYTEGERIRPIAYETFDALNIRGALSYMQKAKHIGKIVCMMPDIKVDNSKILAKTSLFNDRSTYLVTGGLGGIGFEVVKYMLKNGAKHIAIASRSQPKPEIGNLIDSWNKAGNHVQAFAVDIGNLAHCKKLFEELKSPKLGFPPVRGVMHAAGVLHDAIIKNQSWATFQHTYNPKVNGTWNLHECTKDLLLEHFVLYSSIAASLGSPGQTNHSASNSFEDAFANYRKSIGLPATSINWGNWGEVGVATEVDLPGVRPITTAQGLLALETFLTTHRSHISVLNSESFALMMKLFPQLKTFIDDKRLLGETKSTVLINSDEFWSKVDNASNREERLEIFKQFIKMTVRGILKMDSDEDFDDNADFQTLGIDSLMMLEMKNGLQNVLGGRMTLTTTQLKDCTNTSLLANKMVDVLEGGEEVEQQLPTMEELRQLIREDSVLPEHICAYDGMTAKDISKIEVVLLTGSTGTLGPYLLRDLSLIPSIKKIYCLIRKHEKDHPSDKLNRRLKAIRLEGCVNMSKVECIEGDIALHNLGLSDQAYENLAKEVDAVIHAAVRADHTAKYMKSPEGRKIDVRNVNVRGLLRVFEFATRQSLKHVYYASTLLVVTGTTEEGCLSEDWQDIGGFDALTFNSGYTLSKHIAEQLVKQAVERGIPCKTFRLGSIAGESKTGRCDFLSNHIMLRWLAYLKLKCMPEMPTPLIYTSVDHCSQHTLSLFFNPQAPYGCYNICNKDAAAMDQTIIQIAEEQLGIHVEPVPFKQFVEKLKMEDDNSPLAPFKHSYIEGEASVTENFEMNPTVSSLRAYAEDATKFFTSHKLLKYLPNCATTWESTEKVMRRDFKYLQSEGVLEKFGII